mmetsp:Transcript_86568/g.269456  ORF Transcript_86568/g.269456 Transcript_86568/m.269456 type:complete len:224 (+) Transcript_86568:499-1170(+)
MEGAPKVTQRASRSSGCSAGRLQRLRLANARRPCPKRCKRFLALRAYALSRPQIWPTPRLVPIAGSKCSGSRARRARATKKKSRRHALAYMPPREWPLSTQRSTPEVCSCMAKSRSHSHSEFMNSSIALYTVPCTKLCLSPRACLKGTYRGLMDTSARKSTGSVVPLNTRKSTLRPPGNAAVTAATRAEKPRSGSWYISCSVKSICSARPYLRLLGGRWLFAL